MSEHTPEPWKTCADDEEDFDSEYYIEVRSKYSGNLCQLGSSTFSRDDARRIVTCVNACAGMYDPAAEIAALRSQLAERDSAIDSLRDTIVKQTQAYDALRAQVEEYEKALREISIWSQDLQDRTVNAGVDMVLLEWRGCIAIASTALATTGKEV